MKTNRLIALAASVVIATAALAQKPQFMGAGHAIIKVDTQKKYILLPVEEKEENAHIRVVSDNQLVKTLNCRLATDKVDYFVPFDEQLAVCQPGTYKAVSFCQFYRSRFWTL